MVRKSDIVAAGIDLGGTKIEAQLFDADWQLADRMRMDTPPQYGDLLTSMCDMIEWADASANGLPIGIGAAGLVHPQTGRVVSANLCAHGQTLPADIIRAAARPVSYLNDCHAVALSEAVLGAGQGKSRVVTVVMGTGIGGGIAYDSTVVNGPSGTGGEFGHTSAPAALIQNHNLPVFECGCGQSGCVETYISGPGLARLAQEIIGADMTPRDVAAQRDGAAKPVWDVWCALVADLMKTLIINIDPDIIVLGGGLSKIDGVADDIATATARAQLGGFPIPPIVIAQGGDTSGARGAAYAAWSKGRT